MLEQKTKMSKTIQLANLALEIAKENLIINMAMPNSWEVVVLDQEGYITNHKLVKDLTNKEILLWIDQWTTNYEIAKMWRTKQLQPQYICYT